MKKTILTMMGIAIAICAIANDGSNTLKVVIKNFENTEGKARVTYFDSSEDFLKTGKMQIVNITNKEEIIVTFENVPSATLAVSVVHDENANGELDTGVFGIPTEDYGFSNDAKGSFGPPSFEDCQFPMDQNKTIEININ